MLLNRIQRVPFAIELGHMSHAFSPEQNSPNNKFQIFEHTFACIEEKLIQFSNVMRVELV